MLKVLEVNRFKYFVEKDFPLEENIQSLWKHMVINFNEEWYTWQQLPCGQHKTHTKKLFFIVPRKSIFEIKKNITNGIGTMKGLGEITDMLLGLAVSPTDAKKKEYQFHVKWDCKPWECEISKDVIRELRTLNPGFIMHVKKDAGDELGVYYTCVSFSWEENDGIVEVSCVNKEGKKYFAFDVDRCNIEPAQLAAFQHRSVFEIECKDFIRKTPKEQNNMYWAIVLAFYLKNTAKLDEWGVKRVEKTANRNGNFC
jgi:hypothetical protein